MYGAPPPGFDRAGGPETAFLRPSGVNAVGRPVRAAHGIAYIAAKVSNGAHSQHNGEA